MSKNTIVSACDQGYAWGVWLLICSARMHGMTDPVLIGAYNWSPEWISDLGRLPDCRVVELPIADRRSVSCSKPEIMRHAETEFVTWVDCDGIFSGDCSSQFGNDAESIYIRQRTESEVMDLYRREREPGDDPRKIPARMLKIWQTDVAGLNAPRYDRGISAALIGVHRSYFPFLEHWSKQMRQVLPERVSVVNDSSIAYFQTDESVLNSLLLFAEDAPPITTNYRSDRPDAPHFIHFGYNPKPWIMWNRNSIRHFDAVQTIIRWAAQNGYAPQAPLPFPLIAGHKSLCKLLTLFDKPVSFWRKWKKKHRS